jgi:hypothetical protein
MISMARMLYEGGIFPVSGGVSDRKIIIKMEGSSL